MGRTRPLLSACWSRPWRAAAALQPGPSERRREAYMRQTIRAARRRRPGADRSGVRRLACTGAHLAAAAGQRRCGGAARQRQAKGDPDLGAVDRPAARQRERVRGRYPSPGWYHHLWTAPEGTIPRWLVKVARALRERTCRPPAPSSRRSGWPRRWPASGRGRSRPDRGHRGDPGRAGGDERAVRYVTEHLVVGQALGSVNERVPTVPLKADLVRTCRSLRARNQICGTGTSTCAGPSTGTAPSCSTGSVCWTWTGCVPRRATSRARARSARCGRRAGSRSTPCSWSRRRSGAPRSRRPPRRIDQIRRDGTLPELTRTVGRCLLAALPAALDALLVTVAERAARTPMWCT